MNDGVIYLLITCLYSYITLAKIRLSRSWEQNYFCCCGWRIEVFSSLTFMCLLCLVVCLMFAAWLWDICLDLICQYWSSSLRWSGGSMYYTSSRNNYITGCSCSRLTSSETESLSTNWFYYYLFLLLKEMKVVKLYGVSQLSYKLTCNPCATRQVTSCNWAERK